MELRIIHVYPDLMSLYGSYANVAVVKRCLEALGGTVEVETLVPGREADLAGADFLFMGAGTERSQKTALQDFARFGGAVKAAAEDGAAMLFAGTAMELLGETVTDCQGAVYRGIGLAGFTSLQGTRRIVGDVYGATDLYPGAVVGFMNKSSTISGVETPLLTSLEMGFGNEAEREPEGFHWKNVFASHLTGPILVKNPRLLDAVVSAIYRRRGQEPPAERPADAWAEAGYGITAEQLRLRCRQK